MSDKMDVYQDDMQDQQEISESYEDCLLNSKVIELHQALDKLKLFLAELPEQKEEDYAKQIITYSGKEAVVYKSTEEILKLCEKRIQKMLRNKKTKKNWNQDDIDLLVWVLHKYTAYFAKKSVYSFDEDDWKSVSAFIPATSWKKCMFKWLSLKKFSLLTFRWSNTQSQLLKDLIKQNGKKDWKKLSEKLYIFNKAHNKVFRTPKQCRQHWNCYLNPVIKKGPWSIKEDLKLLQTVLQLNCLKKWSEVAKSIKGRTENAVKNRFTLLLEKQRKLSGEQNEKHLINRVLIRLMNEETNERVEMKSQQLDQIQHPNQIFEQSSDSQGPEIEQFERKSITEKKTQEAQKPSLKVEGCNERKIIIPTIVQNSAVYQQPQFYPISSQFVPYFFNLIYGSPYGMS